MDRSRPRRSCGFPCRLSSSTVAPIPWQHARHRPIHHQLPGAETPALPHHLAPSRDAEYRRQLRLRHPGRHLVLNGHIDVFPVADATARDWSRDPWGGQIVDGKIYGRGVADMKAGTTASIFTYAYLHSVKAGLKGRLTLTAVSDEGNLRPVRRPLSHGAPSGAAWRRAAQR